ncbi:MAG: hypothetical protein AAF135_12495 [Bacteroidota bacterium]
MHRIFLISLFISIQLFLCQSHAIWAQGSLPIPCDGTQLQQAFDSTHSRYHHYRVVQKIAPQEGAQALGIKAAFAHFISDIQHIAPVPKRVHGPVNSCDTVFVIVALKRSNPVLTQIDTVHYSVISYALPGHLLYPGVVIRRIEESDHQLFVITESWGEGRLPRLNERLSTRVWQTVNRDYFAHLREIYSSL